jgi:glutamate racemase
MRINNSALICLSLLLFSIPVAAREPVALAGAVATGEAANYQLAISSYQSEYKTLPIGVFDSGIGGLTVLAEILKLDSFNNETHEPGADGRPDFESEKFIYLGDQANMPYGNYAAEHGEDFLRELVVKDGIFLLGNGYWPNEAAESQGTDKPPVKAIVIACNTATAYGLDDLRDAVKLWNLPVAVIGVVEAGAKGALEAAKTRSAVAVLATVGTCRSEGYVRAVEKAFRQGNREVPAVVQQGCLGLAGAVEGDASYLDRDGGKREAEYRGPSVNNPDAPLDTNLIEFYGFDSDGLLGKGGKKTGWQLNSVENYIRYHCLTLAEKYRSTGESRPVGTVILGCTHFPYYRDSFLACFERLRNLAAPDGSYPYRQVLAGKISIIDPAMLTATELFLTLKERKLLLAGSEKPVIQTDEFYISVPNRNLAEVELTAAGAFTYAYKYGRSPGRVEVEYVKRVPMSAANLSHSAMEQIKTGMPGVWVRLVEFSRNSPRCEAAPDSLRFN